jgi:hypothetical protein
VAQLTAEKRRCAKAGEHGEEQRDEHMPRFRSARPRIGHVAIDPLASVPPNCQQALRLRRRVAGMQLACRDR